MMILNLSIKKKLLFYFLLVSIIPILIIGSVSYYITSMTITQKAIELSLQLLEQSGIKIDALLQQSEKIYTVTESNAIVQKQLRKSEQEISTDYSGETEVQSELAAIQSGFGEVISYSIVGLNGSKYKSGFMTQKNWDLRKTPEFKRVVENPDKAVWFPTSNESFVVQKANTDNIFTLGKTINDKLTGKRSGAIFIEFNEKYIPQQSCNQTKKPKNKKI